MYLLSTQALLELASRDDQKPIFKWSNNVNEDHVFLSAISIGQACSTIEQNAGPLYKQMWRDNIGQVISEHEFSGRVFSVDLPVARKWSQLRDIRLTMSSGDPLPQDTRLVIATALAHNKILVTKKESYHKELTGAGLKIEDPWADNVD